MKVLILYNKLFHYRIPIFKLLAKNVDLTVAYSFGEGSDENINFNVVKLPVYKFGRFVIHKNNIIKFCKTYDVVIVYGDIAWLKLSTLSFRKKRKFKVIVWSPGVSASYDKKYDEITKWDSIRDFFYKRADALVFYSNYPIKKYVNRGFNRKKLFVANNTVQVYNNPKSTQEKKDSLLFIGTLYMQKGILTLLENYKKAYITNPDILPLNLIGGGDELQNVKNWVIENKFTHKIFVLGPIFEIKQKYKYFERAIVCISPVQAGLSVLESFGYGVPFITMSDAITGGERFNIKHNINGILMKETSELSDIILDVSANKKKYLIMGENAKEYYNKYANPKIMANGLLEAIKFVIN